MFGKKMRITDDELTEFREIYCQEYGEEISVPEARILATDFLTLMKVICVPIGDEKGLIYEKNNK